MPEDLAHLLHQEKTKARDEVKDSLLSKPTGGGLESRSEPPARLKGRSRVVIIKSRQIGDNDLMQGLK